MILRACYFNKVKEKRKKKKQLLDWHFSDPT